MTERSQGLADDEVTLAEAQAEDADAPQTPTPEPVAEVKAHPWQDGTWHGIPNYRCPDKRKNGQPCNFVTLRVAEIQPHRDAKHPRSWLGEVEEN